MGRTKRITIETVLRARQAQSVALSPDGRRAALVVAEADLAESRWKSAIHLVDLEGGAMRKFTAGARADLAPRWSPDGRTLAFLSNRAGENGNGAQQVWTMPADGGEAAALTEFDEGVRAFAWLPDSRRIVLVAREGQHPEARERRRRERRERRDVTVEDAERYRRQVWIAEVGAKRPVRVASGDFGIAEFDVAPDGRRIAYATNRTGRDDDYSAYALWVLDLDSGEARPLTGRPGAERHPRWSPDGTAIAFVAPSDPARPFSRTDAFVIPAGGGPAVCVTDAIDRNVEDLLWAPGGDDLLVLFTAGAASRLARVSVETRAAAFLSPDDAVCCGADACGGTVAALLEPAAAPPDLWVLRDGDAPRRVTTLNPHLDEYALGEQRVVRWRSADGLEIEGVLTLPPGHAPGRRVPLVVDIHGGPHSRTSIAFRRYVPSQVLAAEGFAVLAPNYRGSAGYGGAFDLANHGDLGGGDFQDVLAGVDAVVAQGIADPARLAVMGGSYGGYLTNWIITQTDRFRAAVSRYGIFSLASDFGNSFIPSWERDYLGGYPWEKPDLYAARSPATHAARIATPVLIVHGDDDPNTFISNSKELYTTLRALGRTVEFVHYPREQHGLREPQHRLDETTRTLAWLRRWLLGAAAARTGAVLAGDRRGLRVIKARWADPYPGTSPEGRYVEVDFRMWAEDEDEVVDLGADLRLAVDGDVRREVPPAGVPLSLSGTRLLLVGGLGTLPLALDRRNAPIVRVTFDVPEGGTVEQLLVRGFPPVALDVREPPP